MSVECPAMLCLRVCMGLECVPGAQPDLFLAVTSCACLAETSGLRALLRL